MLQASIQFSSHLSEFIHRVGLPKLGRWGGSAISWTRAPGGVNVPLVNRLEFVVPLTPGHAHWVVNAPVANHVVTGSSANSWTLTLGSVRSRSEPFELWSGGMWTGSASSWTLGCVRSRSEPFGVG